MNMHAGQWINKGDIECDMAYRYKTKFIKVYRYTERDLNAVYVFIIWTSSSIVKTAARLKHSTMTLKLPFFISISFGPCHSYVNLFLPQLDNFTVCTWPARKLSLLWPLHTSPLFNDISYSICYVILSPLFFCYFWNILLL